MSTKTPNTRHAGLILVTGVDISPRLVDRLWQRLMSGLISETRQLPKHASDISDLLRDVSSSRFSRRFSVELKDLPTWQMPFRSGVHRTPALAKDSNPWNRLEQLESD
jgi:hypothetical protein